MAPQDDYEARPRRQKFDDEPDLDYGDSRKTQRRPKYEDLDDDMVTRQPIEIREAEPPLDLEDKNTRSNKQFRDKRNGIEDDEGGQLRKSKRADLDSAPKRRTYSDDEDAPPRARRGLDDGDRDRGKDYESSARKSEGKRRDPRDFEVMDAPRRRPDKGDPYDDPEPPRRRNTVRDSRPYRDRRDYDDDYDEAPRPRRRADDDRRDDRGYKSDGRDTKKRRDDYDDRDRYRPRGGGGEPRARDRRDDGYGSDRGVRRSDRDRDRGYDRDRDRDRDRDYRSRDDRRGDDRDRRRYDSDRDRDRSRDRYGKRKGAAGFDVNNIGKYVETGQKHYKTVKPIIDQLSKMYFDGKK